jgi:hypothetical protein
MELVANVWPVVDELTGLVQRFLARAYALEADDDTISRTLTALAPADFVMAEVFPIPQRCRYVTPHGELSGCVSLELFHHHQSQILEGALATLERNHAPLQGIATSGGVATGVGIIPRFPDDPYVVVTMLLETADGRLIPQLPDS